MIPGVPGPPDAGGDGYRDRFVPIASWALYDFANTLFSAMVVTLAMPRMLFQETDSDMPMSWASAAALVVAAFLGPLLGALADATRTTLRQVEVFTILCCACSAGLALVPAGSPGLLAVLFAAAFVAYNTAISLYDSFLPDLCSPGRMGTVSGIGVGVGYLGALLGYPAAGWANARWGFDSVCLAAGVLMFLFSIPMFLLVRERRTAREGRFTLALGVQEFRAAHRTVRALPARPALLLFLLGNFLAVDSLNAMIQWVGRFFDSAWGADLHTVIALLMGLSLSGFVLGVLAGRVADARGAGPVLLAAVASLAAVALVDALVPHRGIALWATILLGGFGAAGVWLASRRILVDLVPADRLAEHMGILGITRKASVFGTLLLAGLADHAGWRVAVGSLAAPLLLAIVALEASRRAVLRERAAASAA